MGGMNRDNVEPLGTDGDEQAFRVTFRNSQAIVFHNAQKGVSHCTECKFDKGSCEHVQIVEMYLEINVHTFNWMNYIGYTLENWNRTAFRLLWSLLSDGLLFQRPRDWAAIYEAIQRKLEGMKEHELGYLRMMGAPAELDEDFLEPFWSKAHDWLEKSGAMALYFNEGQFLESKDIST